MLGFLDFVHFSMTPSGAKWILPNGHIFTLIGLRAMHEFEFSDLVCEC